jgi:hypothetical protein
MNPRSDAQRKTATVDVLSQAIEHVRAKLDPASPIHERIRAFWAAVVAARDLGASDIVHDAFHQLAVSTELSCRSHAPSALRRRRNHRASYPVGLVRAQSI